MSVRRRKWIPATGGSRHAWIADFTDLDGHRHIKTFRTRERALAYHATLLNSGRRPLSRTLRSPNYATGQARQFAKIVSDLVDLFLLEDLPGHVIRDVLIGYAGEDFASRRRGLLNTAFQIRSRRESLLINLAKASERLPESAPDRSHKPKGASAAASAASPRPRSHLRDVDLKARDNPPG